ncbi:transposase family protein [Actinomadura bangladeshensis]|uniref:transposase family protein n=1 Tax=Actinomadura bangladeshensis TaxID=453573 RepID=UPI0024426D7D|nr:transposase family protein [Actinomadura bangladeshensis]
MASPDRTIVWVSGPLPGSVHDLKAARIWGLVRKLAASGVLVLADKGYVGAGPHIKTPLQGQEQARVMQGRNRAYAKLCAPGERANARFKNWKTLTK